jgi:hypothetical protein
VSGYIENLSPKEWEAFCAIMLRYHYQTKNFWEVPDQDKGDLGLEFFAIDGTLFQCYCPDQYTDMAGYKKKIQKKIRDDLKKLKKYESQIAQLLDDIKATQWVLIVPELKSKDLIAYCSKKRKELLNEGLSFVDADSFGVKIETASSYPDGEFFAKNVYPKAINIPLAVVSAEVKAAWQKDHSEFSGNIVRKSNALMGDESQTFQDRVVTKYIQIERFLDQLREDHPDLHELVEDSARAQLEKMKDDVLFQDSLDKHFVKGVVDSNSAAFSKHSKFMSEKNMQSLSFGYLSKWLAECFMDFTNESKPG